MPRKQQKRTPGGGNQDSEMNNASAPAEEAVQTNNRANDLSGSDWTRFSISIWSDIRFTPEERKLGHPAMFPTMLVERLIRCLTNQSDRVVLDPFMGSGSTLLAAKNLGRSGIGFDVYENFLQLGERRLAADCEYPSVSAFRSSESVMAVLKDVL